MYTHNRPAGCAETVFSSHIRLTSINSVHMGNLTRSITFKLVHLTNSSEQPSAHNLFMILKITYHHGKSLMKLEFFVIHR
jgi:hypothetical protein